MTHYLKGQGGLGAFNGPTVKNLRTEGHIELKQANKEFNECLTASFLPRWLAGEKVLLNEVCSEQYDKMMEADGAIYGEQPMPIKPVTLP